MRCSLSDEEHRFPNRSGSNFTHAECTGWSEALFRPTPTDPDVDVSATSIHLFCSKRFKYFNLT